MKCVSGRNAELLCINKHCSSPNSFLCPDANDQCKQDHERCSLINLAFLLKKSRHSHSSKNDPAKYEKLKPLQEKAKVISTTIQTAIASANMNKQINSLLSENKALLPEDKEKISKFLNDRKLQSAQEQIFFKLEKELEEFHALTTEFQFGMKETRDRQISDLKKKLLSQREEKQKIIEANTRNLSQLEKSKGKKSQKKANTDIFQSSPKVSNENLNQSPLLKSSKHIARDTDKQAPRKSEKKRRVDSSKIQKKLSPMKKNHIPKGPLFSNITNDVASIYSFFPEGFKTANILYRASENDFSVNRFHEKCDEKRNTVTLIFTQFNKIIGGFTSLPWKSGGGEWYKDSSRRTFIFSLSAGERYPLQDEERAIWCSRNYGPSFGLPDLEIADKANQNENSCANFPKCFNNGNHKQSPGSIEFFCGSKSGYFKIKEWEVYQLTF